MITVTLVGAIFPVEGVISPAHLPWVYGVRCFVGVAVVIALGGSCNVVCCLGVMCGGECGGLCVKP